MKLTLFDKIKLYKLSKDKVMIEKLKSRKLWATVIGGALAVLGSELNIDADLVDKLVSMLMVYISAQAVVDSVEASKKSSK